MTKETTKRINVRCECGALIGGSSEDHANANIVLHKLSKKHKELMEIKKNDK